MKTSEQLDSIAQALVKAQAALKPALKDSTNPAYRSKYADLSAIWEACRKPLTDNGISALQEVTGDEKHIFVLTRFQHSSGQWMEFGPFPVPVTKHDAHGVGSAASYGKRYALAAALGVVSEEDDDGNAATGKPGAPIAKAAPKVEAKPDSQVDKVRTALGELAANFNKERWEKVRAATQKLTAAERDEDLTGLYNTVRKIAESKAA